MAFQATGPILGGARQKPRKRNIWQILGICGIFAGAGWLWINVIGKDLDNGAHIHVKHADEATPVAVATEPTVFVGKLGALPGGPAAAILPGKLSNSNGLDPVAHALLSAARDQLARKVEATTALSEDPRAIKGNSVDLLDRGLGDLLPLRAALLRHRTRDPRLYGLAQKPTHTLDERHRALTIENVAIFLKSLAQSLDVTVDSLETGDLVLLERRHGQRRLILGVVTDVVDQANQAQVVTLDPADRMAREQNPLRNYEIRQHFRLHAADVSRIRLLLDLPVARGALL